MSETRTDVLPDSVTELEYAKPCQTSTTQCDLEATVAVWMSHSLVGCPGVKYMCTKHLATYLVSQAGWLDRNNCCCMCKGSVSGTLGANVRTMPL